MAQRVKIDLRSLFCAPQWEGNLSMLHTILWGFFITVCLVRTLRHKKGVSFALVPDLRWGGKVGGFRAGLLHGAPACMSSRLTIFPFFSFSLYLYICIVQQCPLKLKHIIIIIIYIFFTNELCSFLLEGARAEVNLCVKPFEFHSCALRLSMPSGERYISFIETNHSDTFLTLL